MNKSRSSNIELLRIIAILMIIISHATNYMFDGAIWIRADINFNFLFLNLISIGGQIGVIVFISISSWFMIDSEKFEIRKIVRIVCLCWLICLVYVLVDKYTLNILSTGQIVKELTTPLYNQYWFITTYIVFYLIEPFFRKCIGKINRKQHRLLCVILLIIVLFYNLIFGSSVGYHLADFFSIYVIVGYLKKYGIGFIDNKPKIVFIVSWIFLSCTTFCVNCVLRSIGYVDLISTFYNRLLNINPFTVLCALSLFSYFKKSISISCKVINKLSRLTLGCYIVHENILLRGNENTSSLLWIKILSIDSSFDNCFFVLNFLSKICIVYCFCLFITFIFDLLVDRVVLRRELPLANKIFTRVNKNYLEFIKNS